MGCSVCVINLLQKRFRRLRRIQDEESEEEQDLKTEGELIATELFDTSDNVSTSELMFDLMLCCEFCHVFLEHVIHENMLNEGYAEVDLLYSRVQKNAISVSIGALADIYAFVVAVQSSFEMYSVIFY